MPINLFRVSFLTMLLSIAALTVCDALEASTLKVPNVVSFRPSRQGDPGTPGSTLYALTYSDTMTIKVAVYEPTGNQASSRKPPIGIVAGYAMNISYLHFQAEALRRAGYHVFLVQPPGNGSALEKSQMHDGRDGYHNTIEGFAAMYMDGLGQALSEHYGRKVILMGHSRAGYQMRFFLSGLRYAGLNSQGRAVLIESEEALAAANNNYLGIVSLYSPLSPDSRLVESAKAAPETFERLRSMDQNLRSRRDKDIENAGAVGFVIGATSPLNLAWGLLAGPAALVNGAIASQLARSQARAIAEAIERLVLERTASLLNGERNLDSMDRLAVEKLREKFGDLIPTFQQMQRDVATARWMIGEGVDANVVAHVMLFGNPEGPTAQAADEMSSLSDPKALAGWTTRGVSPQGTPYSILRTILRARQNPGVAAMPFFVFDASNDGGEEASAREAKFLKAQGHYTIDGGHGGAVLSTRALAAMIQNLGSVCQNLLKGAQ